MKFKAKLLGGKQLQSKLNSMAKAAARKAIFDATARGAEAVVSKANERAPSPHVTAEPDDTESRPGRAGFAIGPDKEHWYFIFWETGTSPHEIRPKRKKALSWMTSDGDQTYKVVHHPGMGAQPFLRPAIDDNSAGISKVMGGAFLGSLGLGGGDFAGAVKAVGRAVVTGAAADDVAEVATGAIGL